MKRLVLRLSVLNEVFHPELLLRNDNRVRFFKQTRVFEEGSIVLITWLVFKGVCHVLFEMNFLFYASLNIDLQVKMTSVRR